MPIQHPDSSPILRTTHATVQAKAVVHDVAESQRDTSRTKIPSEPPSLPNQWVNSLNNLNIDPRVRTHKGGHLR